MERNCAAVLILKLWTTYRKEYFHLFIQFYFIFMLPYHATTNSSTGIMGGLLAVDSKHDICHEMRKRMPILSVPMEVTLHINTYLVSIFFIPGPCALDIQSTPKQFSTFITGT